MTAPCLHAHAEAEGTDSPAEAGIDLKKYRVVNRFSFPRTCGDSSSRRLRGVNWGGRWMVLRFCHTQKLMYQM